MRTILLRAGVSVCLLLSVFTAKGATPPKLRLQEQQKIEPVSYRAELTLDPMKDTFAGSLLI
jgi:hypothetical protein